MPSPPSRRVVLGGMGVALVLGGCQHRSGGNAVTEPTGDTQPEASSTSAAAAPAGILVGETEPGARQSVRAGIDGAGVAAVVVEGDVDPRRMGDTVEGEAVRAAGLGTADIVQVSAGLSLTALVPEVLDDVGAAWAHGGFSASMRALASVAGAPVMVPTSTHPLGVLFRRDVFSEYRYQMPKRFLEVVELAGRMRADGLTALGMSRQGLGWMFDHLGIRTYGPTFHRELLAGRRRFDSPQVVTVLRHWEELRPFQQPGGWDRTVGQTAQDLWSGRVGFLVAGTDVAGYTGGAKAVGELELVGFPQVEASAGTDALVASVDGFGMVRRAPHRESALLLLSHLATGPAQEALVEGTGRVAVRGDAGTGGYSGIQRQAARAVSAAREIVQPLDATPQILTGVLEPLLQEWDSGKYGAETIAARAQRRLEALG